MATTSDIVPAGTEFPVWETTVRAARQAKVLGAADVDPARYGGTADPSILATDCILGLRRAKFRLDRVVHLEQVIRQLGPVAIDEALSVSGKVAEVAPSRAGERSRVVFEFRRSNGTVAVSAEAVVLNAEPSALKAGSAEGDPRAGYRLIGRKLLTPPKVQTYTEELANRIHFDPAYAVRFGLRAPTAPGLMELTWLVEALAAKGLPKAFEIRAKFVAPLFWDDGVDILAANGTMRCVNSAGVLTCEAQVQAQ